MNSSSRIIKKVNWNWVGLNGSRKAGGFTRSLSLSYADTQVDDRSGSLTLLLIPGNPGNEAFYERFGIVLLEKLGASLVKGARLILVSHLNHVDDFTFIKDSEHQELIKEQSTAVFDLEDQIRHKFEFCRKFLSGEGKIILIGHSIGGYIALRLMQELHQSKMLDVEACFCLFPAVEKLIETPNGLKTSRVIEMLVKYDTFVKLFLSWIDFAPVIAKKLILRFFIGFRAEESILSAALEVCRPNVLRNIYHMAQSEMNIVREFAETLNEHLKNTVFYYGIMDGWCPLDLAYQMRKRHPFPENVLVDEHGCEHAFVLDNEHSIIVADIIVKQLHMKYLKQ